MNSFIEEKKLDIIIEQGFDFVMAMTLYDLNNNQINLNGSTIEAQMRQFPEATDFFPFEVFHNGLGGRITIKMPHTLTKEISFSSGVYNVIVNFINGTRVNLIFGDVTIIPEGTR